MFDEFLRLMNYDKINHHFKNFYKIGAVLGLIIRYGVTPANQKILEFNLTNTGKNLTVSMNELPDYVQLKLGNLSQSFTYTYNGPLNGVKPQDYEEKATFNPEIFFDVILPPIIFHAGYSIDRVSTN
jgi:sodium/hydrogen exchanger-like protein 6/7